MAKNRDSISGSEIPNLIDSLYTQKRPIRINSKSALQKPSHRQKESKYINFSGVLCRKCVELHLDQCDLCQNPDDYQTKSLSDFKHTESSRNSVLAFLIKEKFPTSSHTNNLENLIENDIIHTDNWSSPFESHLANKRADFLSKRKDLIEAADNQLLLESFKSKSTSEYYFTDLTDLNEKNKSMHADLKLRQCPVPATSNNLYNSIEKFDVSDKYKRSPKISENISDLIQKNSNVLSELNKKSNCKVEKFLSFKKYEDVAFERRSLFFEPPLSDMHKNKFIRKEYQLKHSNKI